MKEHSIQQRILLACGRGLTRLFRNNTGVAWAGKGPPVQAAKTMTVTMRPGDVLLRAAQPIKFGLCVGSSDIIGWKSRVMQPVDVGVRYAIFAALEVKADKGRATDDQNNFIEQVRAAGGIAGVVRSDAEAETLLADER